MGVNRLYEMEQQLKQDTLEVYDADDIVRQIMPKNSKYRPETLVLADVRDIPRESGSHCMADIVADVDRGIIALVVGRTKDKRWINDEMEKYGWFFIEAVNAVFHKPKTNALEGRQHLGNLFFTSHLTTLLFRRKHVDNEVTGATWWIYLRVTSEKSRFSTR